MLFIKQPLLILVFGKYKNICIFVKHLFFDKLTVLIFDNYSVKSFGLGTTYIR